MLSGACTAVGAILGNASIGNADPRLSFVTRHEPYRLSIMFEGIAVRQPFEGDAVVSALLGFDVVKVSNAYNFVFKDSIFRRWQYKHANSFNGTHFSTFYLRFQMS
ncbi:hypothetical protein [Stenotrophobium rhamnosiphilum]|nr:hypothetical protein [Stenotrophobium rhamnosiphilum]